MSSCGIYKIINRITKKYYVGSSQLIDGCRGRWSVHKYKLKYKKHDNDYLQNAWNKYGENNFELQIVEIVPKDKLKEIEQKYLDIAFNEQDKCYNLNFSADRPKWTIYSKKKLSQTMRGRIVSDETKEKISNSHKGKTYSKETIEKMVKCKSGKNNPWWGKTRPDETKEKMSLSHKGHKSYNYDFTIREFTNTKTGNIFKGTQLEFRTEFGFSNSGVNLVVNGKRKGIYDWILTQ